MATTLVEQIEQIRSEKYERNCLGSTEVITPKRRLQDNDYFHDPFTFHVVTTPEPRQERNKKVLENGDQTKLASPNVTARETQHQSRMQEEKLDELEPMAEERPSAERASTHRSDALVMSEAINAAISIAEENSDANEALECSRRLLEAAEASKELIAETLGIVKGILSAESGMTVTDAAHAAVHTASQYGGSVRAQAVAGASTVSRCGGSANEAGAFAFEVAINVGASHEEAQSHAGTAAGFATMKKGFSIVHAARAANTTAKQVGASGAIAAEIASVATALLSTRNHHEEAAFATAAVVIAAGGTASHASEVAAKAMLASGATPGDTSPSPLREM